MRNRDASLGSQGSPRSTQSARAKRQKNTFQHLNTLQANYEKELRRKIKDSNSQVETKRRGGHVEVIQPTKICNDIPFLTSELKAQSLKKYLDSNEPRIVVPKGYIRSVLSSQCSSHDKVQRSSVRTTSKNQNETDCLMPTEDHF